MPKKGLFWDHFEFSLKNSKNRQNCFSNFSMKTAPTEKTKYTTTQPTENAMPQTPRKYSQTHPMGRNSSYKIGIFPFFGILLKKRKMAILYRKLHPLGWVQEYFLGVCYVAFSVGYVVVYFVFSVGAVFMEKFGKQYGLFSEFFKEIQNGPKKRPICFAFLTSPFWPNDIVVARDGQAERNGATTAS